MGLRTVLRNLLDKQRRGASRQFEEPEVPAHEPPEEDPWNRTGPHPYQKMGCLTYAQHGEDIVLRSVFDAIGIERPSFLDIGAHHPVYISNTALFYRQGCRGVNIEANPNLIEAFNKYRPEDVNLNIGVASRPEGALRFYIIDKNSPCNSFDKETIDAFLRGRPEFSLTEVIDVPVITVDQVVEKYCDGEFPDLLSIDVEGMDESILTSISYHNGAPKVICVEVGADDQAGASLKGFLASKGYFSLIRCHANLIMVHQRYEKWVR